MSQTVLERPVDLTNSTLVIEDPNFETLFFKYWQPLDDLESCTGYTKMYNKMRLFVYNRLIETDFVLCKIIFDVAGEIEFWFQPKTKNRKNIIVIRGNGIFIRKNHSTILAQELIYTCKICQDGAISYFFYGLGKVLDIFHKLEEIKS